MSESEFLTFCAFKHLMVELRVKRFLTKVLKYFLHIHFSLFFSLRVGFRQTGLSGLSGVSPDQVSAAHLPVSGPGGS